MLSEQRQRRAASEGTPKEGMCRLSSEHERGEMQIRGAEGTVEDTGKGESWGWRLTARGAGLQCPIKELLVRRTMGLHSMETWETYILR